MAIETIGKRIIVIGGTPGIGKSSLVKQAVHFLNARRIFLGGVVWIQAKGVTMTENLIKLVARSFINKAADPSVQSVMR